MAGDSARIVLITAPEALTAEKLARGLVKAKLAACVNVLPGVVSHYVWKGKPQRDQELLLLVKTREARLSKLIAWVRSHHPAETPEIVALPIVAGDQAYLDWLKAST